MEQMQSLEWSTTLEQRLKSLYLPTLKGISLVLCADEVSLMVLDSMKTELHTKVAYGSVAQDLETGGSDKENAITGGPRGAYHNKENIEDGFAGQAVLKGKIIHESMNFEAGSRWVLCVPM